MSTGHRPGGDSEVPGPCRVRPGPPARPWLIPCPHPSCLTASPQDRSHGSLRSEGGVRHGCEPRAQGRPGPAGEKDGDTATGACAVSVHGCVNVRVHCAGRGVRAGLHKCPKQSGAGTSHRAGGREMHKEHSGAHARLCGLSTAVSLRDTSRTQEWKNVLYFRTFFI